MAIIASGPRLYLRVEMSRASMMRAGQRYGLLPIKGRSTPDASCLISTWSPIEGPDSYQDFQQINLEDCAIQSLESYSRRAVSMSSRLNLMSTHIKKKHTTPSPSTPDRRSYSCQAFYTVPTIFIRSWTEMMINVLGYHRMMKTLPERFGSFL